LQEFIETLIRQSLLDTEHRRSALITPSDIISGLCAEHLLFNSAQLSSLVSSQHNWSNPYLSIMTWLASIGLSQYSAQVSTTFTLTPTRDLWYEIVTHFSTLIDF
jgi:hypothetical protein